MLALDERMRELDRAIVALGSGSPAGVYATVADLQAAFPSGDSRIYLVTGDGKWYYWTGSNWVAGGVYQGTEPSDRSVTAAKLDLSRAGNLFESTSQVELGYFYSGSGTKIADSTLCNVKIPMQPGDILCIYADWRGINGPGFMSIHQEILLAQLQVESTVR